MTISETSSLDSSYFSSFTSLVTSASSKVASVTTAVAQNVLQATTSFAGFTCKTLKGSSVALASFKNKHPTALKASIAAVAILGIGYAVKTNLPRLKGFLPK